MRGDFFLQPGRSEGSLEGSDRIGADGGWIPPWTLPGWSAASLGFGMR